MMQELYSSQMHQSMAELHTLQQKVGFIPSTKTSRATQPKTAPNIIPMANTTLSENAKESIVRINSYLNRLGSDSELNCWIKQMIPVFLEDKNWCLLKTYIAVRVTNIN